LGSLPLGRPLLADLGNSILVAEPIENALKVIIMDKATRKVTKEFVPKPDLKFHQILHEIDYVFLHEKIYRLADKVLFFR